MARPPHSNGAATRERILDVAQELFISQGYDKTSLRDIAQRLDITKAALYYYFERKQDILLELHLRFHAIGDAVLDEIEQMPDGADRVAAWPQLIDRLMEAKVGEPDVMLLHRRNEAAIAALSDEKRNRVENEELQERFTRLLTSSRITPVQRVRMAASVGVMTEVLFESGAAFDDIAPDELTAMVKGIVAEVMAPALLECA